jgi:ABC-2 type transport system permease protein
MKKFGALFSSLGRFSLSRFGAIMHKEFIQMRRDKLTFGIMIASPIIQLLLFGYAINSDPKNLPTAVISADNSAFSRSIIYGLKNSGYFEVVRIADTEDEGNRLIRAGKVQFVISIPAKFERDLIRGKRPQLLIEADATDPAASSNAVSAATLMIDRALSRELRGPLKHLVGKPLPVDVRIHRHYNEEGVSQYNVVPGLMGVILTMTMVMITGLAITRERERGTMENLLATPAEPIEVMLGKIIPYIAVGYIQMSLVILASSIVFRVPFEGSVLLLFAAALPFIAATLSVGITFSTIARTQLQAVQMSFFFFLPSILLSGFMFPFRGMPHWAQALGSILPLTHFLRVVRGIMLKGYSIFEVLPHLVPMICFMVVVTGIALLRYRNTLD